MDCTLNIIGYRNCDREFRYYLDDYGISVLSGSKVVDDKFVNAKQMIDTLISQSWTETINDITFDGMQANKILNDVTFGYMDHNDSFTGTKTVIFTKDQICELGSFYLSQLNLYVKESGLTTVQLIQGTVVSELYHNTPEDDTIIEIAINDFVSDEFQIKVITEGVVWLGSDNVECRCEDRVYYTVESDVIPFVLTFQVRCNKLVHLCKYVDLIAPIVINKVLGKYWFKVHTTDVFSNFVNSNIEKAVSMMVYYDSNYINLVDTERNPNEKNGQYQLSLNKLNIPKPTCKCCMECKTSGWTYQGQKP
jgi:hypothetical protein